MALDTNPYTVPYEWLCFTQTMELALLLTKINNASQAGAPGHYVTMILVGVIDKDRFLMGIAGQGTWLCTFPA